MCAGVGEELWSCFQKKIGAKIEVVNRTAPSSAITFQLCCSMLIAFNKPFGVLSQFTPDGSKNKTLAEFGFPPHVYPVGRLDADSEGLLFLTDNPSIASRLLDKFIPHTRVYHVQVEGSPRDEDLEPLRHPLDLKSGETILPAKAKVLSPQPSIQDRIPPIRFRAQIPTTWIELTLLEGKNRQVRRMTAKIGFPTLRLIRVAIGVYDLIISEGSWKKLTAAEENKLIATRRTP